ncbi:MAG: hypothetical protein KIT84_29190 [Labilithrix sp.]|nr:hypothetical protein [Labilithrix sp.]MCW5815137.1 hypothetical protein [Labilithrix sp.]
MRGAWIFALALCVGGGAACLVSIDESRLSPKGDDDDDDARDATSTPKKDSGGGPVLPDPDASVDPTKTPDGGLSCPEPTSLCDDRCFDLATSNAHCGACSAPCTGGTTCTNKVCRAASCKQILAQGNATTGPATITFQGSALDVFCDQTAREGGWTMVHRLSAGLTGDPFTFYTSIPLNDTVAAELTPKKSGVHYTSRILSQLNQQFAVTEAMLRVYDAAGNPVKEIVFDATGATFTTFMTPARIKASSYSDLNGAVQFVDFGVGGDQNLQRRFLVHKKYEIPPGCPADTGWLMVHGTIPDAPCKTEYEAPLDRIRILYAPGTTAKKWSDGGYGEASSFVVFVR